MEKYDHQFDPDVYIDAVRRFYSAPNGKMLSLPWNVSTGILYYNKDAFKKQDLIPRLLQEHSLSLKERRLR